MSWKEPLSGLDPRERRLLSSFVAVLSLLVLIVAPFLTMKAVWAKQSENEALRKAIDSLVEAQPALQKSDAQRQSILARYGKAAPPLGAFLDNQARQNGIEIPESQDRPVVPHGKRFEERSTRIQLRKVGMANLARFMESVEKSQFPIIFSRVDIRKRLSESDSYDVEVIASAYDRKEPLKVEGSSAAAASASPSSAKSAGSAL